ncbi:hypothetical protein Acr_00g0049270 [Actinidia rufa]|uniref:RNase H type-1 domain-containing protein n=1 Tax=Actinidia rufa TaxID=165716 RepID=A0A7J0DKE7_9ERIC|nr:hypothetical protein Acr_00g0049270 [Actinidia rufa]
MGHPIIMVVVQDSFFSPLQESKWSMLYILGLKPPTKLENEALLADLRVATELEVEFLNVYSDSQLVVNQVQGDYLAHDIQMVAYLDEVKAMSMKIKDFNICQFLREENKKADALTNLASAFDFISGRGVPLEFMPNPSIDITKIVCQATTNLIWIDVIIAYLKDEKLSSDKLQARRLQYRDTRVCLLHGTLYKRFF